MPHSVASGNKVEMTLSKVLIVVLLLMVLMSMFLFYFFKQEQQIEQAGLQSITSLFSSKLMVVRSQWLMEGKPQHVNVKESQTDSEGKIVSVNQFGWIDVKDSDTACQDIWSMIMERPLAFFNMPIGAILVTKGQNKNLLTGHLCRYTVQNGQYFEYNSVNGKVSVVKKSIEL